jgi:hypothetical protein
MKRIAAGIVSLALVSGCAHKQLTNKQVASGVVAAGAVVGLIVLLSLVQDCERRYGECKDPGDPPAQ